MRNTCSPRRFIPFAILISLLSFAIDAQFIEEAYSDSDIVYYSSDSSSANDTMAIAAKSDTHLVDFAMECGVKYSLLNDDPYRLSIYWVPSIPFLAGFRISIDGCAIDLMFGGNRAGAVKSDSSTNTAASPTSLAFELSTSLHYALYRKSKLRVYAFGDFTAMRYDSYEYYPINNYPTKDQDIHPYASIIQIYSIGTELEAQLLSCFSVFSRIALADAFIPNSKTIITDAYGYTQNPVLTEKKDARSVISVEGIAIGLRYYFR
jgi:hypothetical protein